MYRVMFRFVGAFVLLLPAVIFSQPGNVSEGIVISQIYGAGGNSGAVYRNDFVELFNRGSEAVSIDGWSLQYASARSTTWQKSDLNGRIEPGGRFLIHLSGGSNGIDLPEADATGSINLSATAGKVALVRDGGLLGAACPPTVVDLVGYGSTASCFEGSGPAPAPSSSRSIIRAGEGCADSNDNSADFATADPAPRNAAAPRQPCDQGHEQGLPASSELGGDKAGSILIFPLYSSGPSGHVLRNTRFNLTNIDPAQSVSVRLYLVDGDTGASLDGQVCLSAGQTATFLASDLDPGVTGFALAVAVDPLSGCPVRANQLIGDAFVKLDGARSGSMPAHAVAAISDPAAACTTGNFEIAFDGLSYNRLPSEVAISNLRLDGNDPLIVLLRPDAKIGDLTGLLFDDAENSWGLAATVDGSHTLSPVAQLFPVLPANVHTILATGRSGWLKFRCADGGPLLGAVIGRLGARNLHILSLAAGARWVMPVIQGGC